MVASNPAFCGGGTAGPVGLADEAAAAAAAAFPDRMRESSELACSFMPAVSTTECSPVEGTAVGVAVEVEAGVG